MKNPFYRAIVGFSFGLLYCVFIYWTGGNEIERSPVLAGAFIIGSIIGTVLAVMCALLLGDGTK